MPPPELFDSDDSDEYDGMFFSGDYDEDGKRIRNKESFVPVQVNKQEEIENDLYRCAFEGDINEFREIWNANGGLVDINKPLKTSWTPLMCACQNLHVDLVKYLLFELNADPNANSADMTALIWACCGSFTWHSNANEVPPEEEAKSLQICQWLLQCNAMVNKANLRNETALMHAASSGYVSVIQLLLSHKATLEAVDNEGKTALFYAVSENRYNATKLLIDCGALIDTENQDHLTPKKVAQDKGFSAIVELFPPDPIIQFVPNNVRSYDTYKDLIPAAFPDNQAPAYSPDVYTMLYGMRAGEVEYEFYKSRIGLTELLTITDDRLKDIGIEFPYHRKRILHGLLKFHEKSWSKNALCIPKFDDNIQKYFDVFSNCLKQLLVIEATLKFVDHHPIFGAIPDSDEAHKMRQKIHQQLFALHKNAMKLFQHFVKVNTLAPPPPLHVCSSMMRSALNNNSVFTKLFYQEIKIFGFIGLGAAIAYAVLRSRSR